MRRYVPIALPALVVFAAVAIALPLAWRRRRLGRGVAAALAALLLAGLLHASRHVLAHRDFAGVTRQLEALESHLAPGAILLISEPARSLFADTFGIPLRFVFGHDVVTVHSALPRSASFLEALLERAERLGRPVQAIAVDPMLPPVQRSLELQPVAVVPVVGQALIHTYDAPPAEMQTARYEVEIYDVARRDPLKSTAPEETTIDVGGMDTAFLASGFFAKEPVDPTASGRWAGDVASIQVPAGNATSGVLEIRAIAYRPANAPPGRVEVIVDGRTFGSFIPAAEWRTFRFSGPLAPIEGHSIVVLRSETFNPKRLGVSGDDRDLGVYVDWLRFAPDRGPSQAAATRSAPR
jgi:hypothetical protein